MERQCVQAFRPRTISDCKILAMTERTIVDTAFNSALRSPRRMHSLRTLRDARRDRLCVFSTIALQIQLESRAVSLLPSQDVVDSIPPVRFAELLWALQSDYAGRNEVFWSWTSANPEFPTSVEAMIDTTEQATEPPGRASPRRSIPPGR